MRYSGDTIITTTYYSWAFLAVENRQVEASALALPLDCNLGDVCGAVVIQVLLRTTVGAFWLSKIVQLYAKAIVSTSAVSST